jgi:hypothetical protein
LNHVFELVGVAYGPRPVPSTEEFIEAMKKRKLDATGMNQSKRPKAVEKKKMEAVKAPPSWGKTSLKRPFAAEVTSVRPLKQSKKATLCPVVAVTTTCVSAGVWSSNVAAGASSSKGMAGAKKAAMPIRKRCIPAIGTMVAESLEESQESSSHGQATWVSTAKIVSRSEPRGQSSRASLLDSAPRLEPELLDTAGASILDVTTAVATG